MAYETVHAVAWRAALAGYGENIRHGAPGTIMSCDIRAEMDCERPFWYQMFGRSRKILDRKVCTVDVWSRCRKCFPCQRRRSMFWAARAASEYERWPRTLMGTFTLSPAEHDVLDWRIEAGLPGPEGSGRAWERAPVNLGSLSEDEKFSARAQYFGDEVTKWFKRLKSGHGQPGKRRFRYLLIAEAHDSEFTDPLMKGRPHFHCLLHETEVGALVEGDPAEALIKGQSGEWEKRNYKTRKGWREGCFVRDEAFIRTEWKLGFTKFQLCDNPGSAMYVCKYLSKAMRVRVRPSNRYGPPEKAVAFAGGKARAERGLPMKSERGTTTQESAEEGGPTQWGELQGGSHSALDTY